MLTNALLPLLVFFQDNAPEGGTEESSSPNFLLPMLAIGAIFWFVMIAPERKRRKEREGMISALKKGDKVMTTSGMYGTVAQVQGEVVTVQIADNVRVKFALAAIQGQVDEEGKKDGKKGGDKTLLPQKASKDAKDQEDSETAEQDEVVESK